MKTYAIGAREERALVKELKALLQLDDVIRLPLSKGFKDIKGDVLLTLDSKHQYVFSVKFGSQVPSWMYRYAAFQDQELIAGPLWLLKPEAKNIIHLLAKHQLLRPDFVQTELEYADFLAVRARGKDWRVIGCLDTFKKLWKQLERRK